MKISLTPVESLEPANQSNAQSYVVNNGERVIWGDPYPITGAMFRKMLESGRHLPDLPCDEDDDL